MHGLEDNSVWSENIVIFGAYNTRSTHVVSSLENTFCIFFVEEIWLYKYKPYKLYFLQISNVTKVCSIFKIVLRIEGVQNLLICIFFFVNWGSWKSKIQMVRTNFHTSFKVKKIKSEKKTKSLSFIWQRRSFFAPCPKRCENFYSFLNEVFVSKNSFFFQNYQIVWYYLLVQKFS